MRWRPLATLIACTVATVTSGCTSMALPAHDSSSSLEFLYPARGGAAAPAQDVTLRLPLRVGLAFAPRSDYAMSPISEAQRQALLDKVAAAFTAHRGIGHIEVVPAVYLRPGGSFTNLDQLSSSLGLDQMVLLSYDQTQFTESTRASWTYLTVVGPLIVEGEKNDTRTLMDAAVYDIRSRALLFRAAGESVVKGSSSPLNESRKRRLFADQGFDKATVDLIAHLQTALDGFEQQARTGTVHGTGTPALAILDPSGHRVNGPQGGGGGGGAGALGTWELLAIALLAAAGVVGHPRRHAVRNPPAEAHPES